MKCKKQFFENNETPTCKETGVCNRVDFLFEDRNKPLKLSKNNKIVAEILRRTLNISNRKQISLYNKNGGKDVEEKKMLPTLSHLGLVMDNYHTTLSKKHRSYIVYLISNVYQIIINQRLT